MNVAFLPPENPAAELLPQTAPETETVSALADTPEKSSESVIAALLETSENVEQKRRALYRLSLPATILVWAAYCLLQFIPTLFHLPHQFLLQIAGVLLPFVAMLIFFASSSKLRLAFKQQEETFAALVQFPNDPRLLLPLVDALHSTQTPQWEKEAYPLLTERLWELSPADALLSLDDTRRTALRKLLFRAYNHRSGVRREANAPDYFNDTNADLAVAIMKTLAEIGDAKTAKVLQKIIKAEAVTPNEKVVRDAARAVLPVLTQKRTESELMQQQLHLCAGERIRDPQKVLREFLDAIAPDEAKSALLECWNAQKKSSAVLRTFAMGYAVFYALLCLGLGFIFHTDFAVVIFTTFFILLLIGALVPFCGSHGNLTKHKIADELSRRTEDDLRLLPVLLNVACSKLDAKQDDAVRKALVRLLPQLKPGDAALVPPAQRRYLRSWLRAPRRKKNKPASQTLTIAALNAVAAIGDTKALPHAEKIARRTVSGTLRETELHEAALRCVEALRARKNQAD